MITGGAGFIGTKLQDALQTGEPTVVLDNLHEQVHGEHPQAPESRDNVRFVRGDVTDAALWDQLLDEVSPRVIVHLAAETGTGQSLLQASRHTSVNVHGTAVMLDALSRHSAQPESMVLTSSRAVYGEGAWLDETSGLAFDGMPRTVGQLEAGDWLPYGLDGQKGIPLPHAAATVWPRPANVYAATKLAQEHLLTAWCSSLDVGLSILRLQNVYGAGQALGNPYTGVLTHFASELNRGKALEIFEGGGIVRDFVHVSDVVSALVTAMQSPLSRSGSTTVDIGSGSSGTLEHFATVLTDARGGFPPTITSNYRLGDVRAAFANNLEAEKRLGYSPRRSFENGAHELLLWAAEQLG